LFFLSSFFVLSLLFLRSFFFLSLIALKFSEFCFDIPAARCTGNVYRPVFVTQADHILLLDFPKALLSLYPI
jgi:hypothetical protein